MTMQSVLLKENHQLIYPSVHAQSRTWNNGRIGSHHHTMRSAQANNCDELALFAAAQPKKITTSLELSTAYNNNGNQLNNNASSGAKKGHEHHQQDGVDENRITTQFTLLSSDCEVGDDHRQSVLNRQKSATPLQINVSSSLQTPNMDYRGNLERGFRQPLFCAQYPFSEPSYGVYPTYGAHVTGRVMLPGNMTSDGDMPIFVNAKQYEGIMRRRKKRAEREAAEKKVLKLRKPYMHLSRHLHAMRRPRGSGGRFLNSKSANVSDKEIPKKSKAEEEEDKQKQNLPCYDYNNPTGSQISEVLQSDHNNNNSGGVRRSNSPGSEVSSHNMFSFDMNQHHHRDLFHSSIGPFSNTMIGLGMNVLESAGGYT